MSTVVVAAISVSVGVSTAIVGTLHVFVPAVPVVCALAVAAMPSVRDNSSSIASCHHLPAAVHAVVDRHAVRVDQRTWPLLRTVTLAPLLVVRVVAPLG